MLNRVAKRGIIAGVVGVVGLTAWLNFTEVVSQGHVGVIFDRTQGGVQSEVLTEGLNFVSPFAKITEYPISVETVKYSLSLPTADTKTITIPIVFDYHNDPQKVDDIYREWRGQKPEALEKGYLRNSMVGIASEVTSKYTILELNSNRAEIQTKIMEAFTKKVGKKGFTVTSVVLGTPDYDAQTKEAIQQVVNKQQEVKALEVEKQKAELNAQKQEIEAKGNATKQLIDAQAEADANRKIKESLSPELIQKIEAEARLKHGWVTVQTGQAIVDADKK